MPSLRATARAVVALSPVSMTIAMPCALQRVKRGERGRFDRIGDGEEAGKLAVDGDEDHGSAVGAQSLGLALQRDGSDAEFGQKFGIAERNAAGRSTMPTAPLPAGASKPRDRTADDIALGGGRDDRGGERMFARALDARGEPQERGLRRNPAPARLPTSFGLPSVSVPVLSTTSVSTFSMRSSASAFLIRMPKRAARPTPTMIDIGVASPSAQGQAMMRTRDCGDERRRQARLRPENRPGREGNDRAAAITAGTNQPAT